MFLPLFLKTNPPLLFSRKTPEQNSSSLKTENFIFVATPKDRWLLKFEKPSVERNHVETIIQVRGVYQIAPIPSPELCQPLPLPAGGGSSAGLFEAGK